VSDPIEIRLQKIEEELAVLKRLVLKARSIKGAISLVDLKTPINECTICDGSGHLLTAHGVKNCECYEVWRERIRVWSELCRTVRYGNKKGRKHAS
jgi:hypothetical protein